jgi:hypothetical protein
MRRRKEGAKGNAKDNAKSNAKSNAKNNAIPMPRHGVLSSIYIMWRKCVCGVGGGVGADRGWEGEGSVQLDNLSDEKFSIFCFR